MNVLDTIYRVFMFVLPYTVCVAAYWWVGKKAWRAPKQSIRIVALLVIAIGIAFTVYRLVRFAGRIFSNDDFEWIVMVAMVANLALASIVLAIGEPEK